MTDKYIKGKDYTKLPLGTKLQGGEIKTCPHCQRLGLELQQGAKTFYSHIDAMEFDGPDFNTIHDMCPKPQK